jgi:hypothetical protein
MDLGSNTDLLPVMLYARRAGEWDYSNCLTLLLRHKVGGWQNGWVRDWVGACICECGCMRHKVDGCLHACTFGRTCVIGWVHACL